MLEPGSMTTYIFGEAMLEYHCQGGAGSGLRFGGDTLNTAIHLVRSGHHVCYVTAVGTDLISDALVAKWEREGIDTRHVLRHPSRSPGIYAIRLEESGERHFLYWRDQSAARDMFNLDGIDAAMAGAAQADLMYFSLISLAILDDAGRKRLLDLAAARKSAGRAVAYDSNFRPSLWPDIGAAQKASRKAMEASTIGLPTNSDEEVLWQAIEAETAIAQRWREAGMATIAVKAGPQGCFLASADDPHACQQHPAGEVDVIDSSGAGDAFNGGFLAAWLHGQTPDQCVEAGQANARRTLAHQGAILLS